jgi:hypothetical protein
MYLYLWVRPQPEIDGQSGFVGNLGVKRTSLATKGEEAGLLLGLRLGAL